MKLYVVRHGQTNYNIANKVCGKSDVELTDLGKQQAKKQANNYKILLLILFLLHHLKELIQQQRSLMKTINYQFIKIKEFKKLILVNLKVLLIMKNFNIINKIMPFIILKENLYFKLFTVCTVFRRIRKTILIKTF